MNAPKLVTAISLFTLTFASVLRADPVVAPAPAPVPAPKPAPAASAGWSASDDDLDSQMRHLNEQLQRARKQVQRSVATLGKNRDFVFHSGWSQNAFDRPLVIASLPLPPADQAEINEDLKIMGKLIGDAVADDIRTENRAMGIAVNYLPSSSSRALYVEGYGAIFQMAVRFPLAPAEKEEGKEPPVRTNSAWDTARRELYGSPDDSDDSDDANKQEVYDAGRVESLKKSLLKAMANVNNFRRLKSGDKVTVVVRDDRKWRKDLQVSFGDAFTLSSSGRSARAGAAPAEDKPKTMTVSVKKSDADALAGGKIKEDEFFKRAVIAIY